MERTDFEEYLMACESQLNNVLSYPIETGDYSLHTAKEADEIIFLEDEIEAAKGQLDLFEDEDELLKKYLGLK